MSWAKIDDKFHSHPKTEKLLDHAQGPAAIGLWTLALAYCSDHLTDGRVPRAFVRRKVGNKSETLARLLVDAGFWIETDDGWAFHDYHDRNPYKADVIAKRADTSEKRAAAGHLGGARSGETRRSKIEANAKQTDDGVASDVEAKPKQKVESRSKQNEAPTRPDPTRPVQTDPEMCASHPSNPVATPPVSGQSEFALEPQTVEPPHQLDAEVQVVYGAWRQWHPRMPERLVPVVQPPRGKPRKPCPYLDILGRLGDAYSTDSLVEAVQRQHRSIFHLGGGENRKGKPYLSLSLAMRDREHVERFLELREDEMVPLRDAGMLLRPGQTRPNRKASPAPSQAATKALPPPPQRMANLPPGFDAELDELQRLLDKERAEDAERQRIEAEGRAQWEADADARARAEHAQFEAEQADRERR